MGGHSHKAGEDRISFDDTVVRGMIVLFPHDGQYEIRKVVAYGSGFLDKVLASAVGEENQVMVLAAQLKSPELEYQADFKKALIENHSRIPEIMESAVARAIAPRAGPITDQLAKRMMVFVEKESKEQSKTVVDFFSEFIYSEQRVSRMCISGFSSQRRRSYGGVFVRTNKPDWTTNGHSTTSCGSRHS